MKKISIFLSVIFISISLYLFVPKIILYLFIPKEDYYIPKPKAKIKIDLLSSDQNSFSDDIVLFKHSKPSLSTVNKDTYKIDYPIFDATINFKIKNFEDLNTEIYNFENSIVVHEKQGAFINANIIKDTSENVYGVLCYLEGDNIATSSQFFVTDSTNYFMSGGLTFSFSITPEIKIQNEIMKQEVFNFINSFKWTAVSE